MLNSWDKEIHATFKARAYQKIEDLKVGAEWWCYGTAGKGTIVSFVTNREWKLEYCGVEHDNPETADDICAIKVKCFEDNEVRMQFLGDRLAVDYNPWLAFSNQKDHDEYDAAITPTIVWGESDFDYDDSYGYDLSDEEGPMPAYMIAYKGKNVYAVMLDGVEQVEVKGSNAGVCAVLLAEGLGKFEYDGWTGRLQALQGK